MRAAFGLAGLLVVVGIIVVVWATTGGPTRPIEQSQPAREEALRLSGQQATGPGLVDRRRVTDTYQLEAAERNGRFEGLRITRMDADSAMADHFGLREGDVIVAVGPLNLSDYDRDMAEALVAESYQRRQDLSIVRNGMRLQLPQAGAPATQQPDAAPQPPPGAPPDDGRNPINRQLDQIPGIRR